MIWSTEDRKQVGTCIVNEVAKRNARKGASTLGKLPDSQCSRAICYDTENDVAIIAANDGQVHIGWGE
jgi:hypothetical protein